MKGIQGKKKESHKSAYFLGEDFSICFPNFMQYSFNYTKQFYSLVIAKEDMGRGEGTTDIWVILNLKITIFQYYKEAHIW